MIFSIGHSTHSPDEFVKLARGIDVIVDVRSHPTSRWEQWRLENMHEWLPVAGFRVEWCPDLGGWTKKHYERYYEQMARVGVDLAAYSKGAFPKQRIGVERPGIEAEPGKPVWTNQGLHDYAWYTATSEFWTGLTELVLKYGRQDQPNAALLCAEALWWKCHRSMIADVLWFLRQDTLHLPPTLPKRETTPRWKRHSEIAIDRFPRYPGEVIGAWEAHLNNRTRGD